MLLLILTILTCKQYNKSLLECDININKIVKQIDNKDTNKDSLFYNSVYFVINILYNHIFPRGYPIKAPIPADNNEYIKLLKLYINKKLKSSYEKKKVQQMLYTKLCYCIKKIELNNIFKEKFLDLKKKDNPYPICLKSIYIKRKIKIPKNPINRCKTNFGWYRANNYRGVI